LALYEFVSVEALLDVSKLPAYLWILCFNFLDSSDIVTSEWSYKFILRRDKLPSSDISERMLLLFLAKINWLQKPDLILDIISLGFPYCENVFSELVFTSVFKFLSSWSIIF